ncbi:MAG TPA: GAF and ANTAR domain-containing protein [Propionibacteriaceae bacterium]|nr:GAF and ANTAR domain-containing protein [Propionibacteriaceae bacterium]
MTSEDAEILDVSESLLHRLTPGDLDATLHSITHAAVAVLPDVHYSSITMRHTDGTLDSYAVTDKILVELDEHQFALKEGPCYDGATNDPFAVSADLQSDKRYPRYGPIAAEAGIHSQAGIRLFENNKTVGALNIFSRDVGAFENVSAVARLFSHQAAIALAYSIQIQGLNDALRTRTRIGQAVGIVMERYKIPEQQAFAFLTRLSQHRNVKLRLIADELIAAVARS